MTMLRDRLYRYGGIAALCAAPFAILLALGCDTTRLAANSTAGVFRRAAPALEQYWDYRTAGAALPASIMQLEGVARVIPENRSVLAQLMRSYVGYGYGWVEDEADDLELAGDFEAAEEERRRARQMYLRSRDLGRHYIALDHDGFDQAMGEGLPAFEAWLAREFRSADDSPVLFWTGYAWGSYIAASLTNIDAVADLAYARALVRRSVELDPLYYNSAGLTFLAVAGTVELNADLDQAKAMFEQAIAQTERRALLALVNMAHYYAVRTQDRELYVSLLTEVLDAGNVLPEAQLNNRVAKRRAKRYLAQVDERF